LLEQELEELLQVLEEVKEELPSCKIVGADPIGSILA